MINNRPLSPHLSIHKKFLSSVLSIFHRLTGFGLSIGTIFIALWVAMIALGPNYFIIFQSISSFIVFKILLFIWTAAIFFHLYNGVRYLYWSFGIGLELKTINSSGYLVLLLTILSTIIVWITL